MRPYHVAFAKEQAKICESWWRSYLGERASTLFLIFFSVLYWDWEQLLLSFFLFNIALTTFHFSLQSSSDQIFIFLLIFFFYQSYLPVFWTFRGFKKKNYASFQSASLVWNWYHNMHKFQKFLSICTYSFKLLLSLPSITDTTHSKQFNIDRGINRRLWVFSFKESKHLEGNGIYKELWNVPLVTTGHHFSFLTS